jgi:hypothetical protein
VLLTLPLFFSGIVFSTLIGRADVNISTALAYNLMGALFWRIDGIQLDVFRILVPVSVGDGFLFPGMDVFLGSGRGMDAAEAGHSYAGFGALRKAMTA